MGQGQKINNAILLCSKLFHHAHNFEYTLQWAVHNPNINWLCEAVTLERKLKAFHQKNGCQDLQTFQWHYYAMVRT